MKPRRVLWIDVATAVVAAGLLCMLLLPQARAAEPWDTTDKVLGTTAVALQIVDWGQTRYIAKHPEQYRESGPVTKRVIGEHPSVGQVDAYFVVYIATTLLIADRLSPPIRKVFLGVTSVIQISVTAHNRSIGVKMSFR